MSYFQTTTTPLFIYNIYFLQEEWLTWTESCVSGVLISDVCNGAGSTYKQECSILKLSTYPSSFTVNLPNLLHICVPNPPFLYRS